MRPKGPEAIDSLEQNNCRGAFPSRLLCVFMTASLLPLVFPLAFGCTAEPEAPLHRSRVLLVGVDGATLRIIEPLMAAGRLPTFSAIANEGTYGVLRTYPPFKSPRIWTTIATGRSPKSHRILDFRVKRADGSRRLVASHDREGPALWNIATDRGLSVATINWWVTYPPERIDGVMVSDHFLASVVDGRARFFDANAEVGAPVVHPGAWLPTVADVVAQRTKREADEAAYFFSTELPAWVRSDQLAEWYFDDATVGALAAEIEATLKPDLALVLLKGVDPASHVLYATTLAEADLETALSSSPAQTRSGAEILYRFYEQADELIGRLLEGYGENDFVFIVSDHGFDVRDQFTKGMTGGHRRGEEAARGIVFARGPGIASKSSSEGVDILDIAPTILVALGLPVASDMDGEPAAFLNLEAPTETVASYDTGPIDRYSTSSAGAEEAILEQLEVLGYFESDSSEDAASAPPEP
jgi:hypothetical protein